MTVFIMEGSEKILRICHSHTEQDIMRRSSLHLTSMLQYMIVLVPISNMQTFENSTLSLASFSGWGCAFVVTAVKQGSS